MPLGERELSLPKFLRLSNKGEENEVQAFICAGGPFQPRNAQAQVASHQPTQLQSQPQSHFIVPSTYLRPEGKPVARVNGVVLTDADLVREEYAIFPYAAQHGGKIPGRHGTRHSQGRAADDYLRGAGLPGCAEARHHSLRPADKQSRNRLSASSSAAPPSFSNTFSRNFKATRRRFGKRSSARCSSSNS